jgi:NAD(P)-dependent dehydrogenase (short-subunit alcohol dehydrogenase family)
MSDAEFSGQVVVVTGASGQIGSECAREFAVRGARVAAVDVVDPADGASGLPASVLSIRADLSEEREIDRVFEQAERELGPLDVLVQSAAVIARMPFLEITRENIDHVFGVNVAAILLGARAAARTMFARPDSTGSIVNLSSVSGLTSAGDGNAVVYEASKGAVTMATKSMAVALAPFGIRVNAVAPGSMTKWQEMEARAPDDLTEYELERTPLGRHAIAADISSAVCFLASPGASFITGTVLYVDGGRLSVW